ncbi:MAG: hypothetical protein R6T92_06275, partial [Desulfosalsimonadaceae bacterium]
NFDGFVKSPISALRKIFEESHVRRSTIDSSKIPRALILNILQSRLKTTFYEFINFYDHNHFYTAVQNNLKTDILTQ